MTFVICCDELFCIPTHHNIIINASLRQAENVRSTDLNARIASKALAFLLCNSYRRRKRKLMTFPNFVTCAFTQRFYQKQRNQECHVQYRVAMSCELSFSLKICRIFLPRVWWLLKLSNFYERMILPLYIKNVFKPKTPTEHLNLQMLN